MDFGAARQQGDGGVAALALDDVLDAFLERRLAQPVRAENLGDDRPLDAEPFAQIRDDRVLQHIFHLVGRTGQVDDRLLVGRHDHAGGRAPFVVKDESIFRDHGLADVVVGHGKLAGFEVILDPLQTVFV